MFEYSPYTESYIYYYNSTKYIFNSLPIVFGLLIYYNLF